MFSLVFKPSVEKDLRSLPQKTVARVFDHAEKLQQEPFPRGSRKLSGAERLHRIRIGDYRMIYEVDQDGQGRLAGLDILDAVRHFGDQETLHHVTFKGLGPVTREQRVG